MSKKVIARFYATYGKMEGDELVDGFIGDDSGEFRKEQLDNISYDYAYDSEEEFINGDINSFAYASYGGDWDDPTGGYIVIRTKQELIDAIKKRAAEEIKEIEESFERADE